MHLKKYINYLLVALIVLENTFLFIARHADQSINSVCYFLASIAFGIFVFYKFHNASISEYTYADVKQNKKITLLLFALFAGGLAWMNTMTIDLIKQIRIDPNWSDIIPTIQILARRFLTGLDPYDPEALSSLYYHTPSTYMPMHWLPYCFAEWFQCDYRTITFSIWVIASTFLMIRCIKIKNIAEQFAVLILIFFTYFLIVHKRYEMIAVTVETMVAGYYMMMIIGLNQKNAFLQGLLIAICMLSRYTLLLWLPFWFYMLFISGNYKTLFKACSVIIVFVSVVYIIPFLSTNWSAFYDAHRLYETNTVGAWRQMNANNLPVHLYNGVGLAHFFYAAYLKTDIQQGFVLLRTLLFGSLIASLVIMGIWYWFNKHKIHYKIVLMASFKIYLTIFLALIMVPYDYLMITGNFVSIAILAEQARYRVQYSNK